MDIFLCTPLLKTVCSQKQFFCLEVFFVALKLFFMMEFVLSLCIQPQAELAATLNANAIHIEIQ